MDPAGEHDTDASSADRSDSDVVSAEIRDDSNGDTIYSTTALSRSERAAESLPSHSIELEGDINTVEPAVSPESLSSLLFGKLLGGKYLVEKAIGQGGAGTVFAATDIKDVTKVAVKVLSKTATSDPESLKRFNQETKTTKGLRHPNIVRIFAYDIEQDHPYYVMEYLAGGTLRDLLAEEASQHEGSAFSIGVERSIDIVRQVCAALELAHLQGVVHRDIKPGNIMFVDETRTNAKLVDFGLAKLLSWNFDSIWMPERENHLTHTGDVFGTPMYLSPEQAKGKRIDQRSDIYALGCVFYECLTGRPPHLGANAVEILLQKQQRPPIPIRELNSACPELLEKLILKMLEKDIKRRYQSISDVANDLDLFKIGQLKQSRFDWTPSATASTENAEHEHSDNSSKMTQLDLLERDFIKQQMGGAKRDYYLAVATFVFGFLVIVFVLVAAMSTISLDSFVNFSEPERILQVLYSLVIAFTGYLLISQKGAPSSKILYKALWHALVFVSGLVVAAFAWFVCYQYEGSIRSYYALPFCAFYLFFISLLVDLAQRQIKDVGRLNDGLQFTRVTLLVAASLTIVRLVLTAALEVCLQLAGYAFLIIASYLWGFYFLFNKRRSLARGQLYAVCFLYLLMIPSMILFRCKSVEAKSLLLKAEKSLAKQSYLSAIKSSTEVLNDNPSLIKAYWIRAQAKFEAGQTRAAIEDLDVVIRKWPDDSGYLLLRGKSFLQEKEYEHAIIDIEKAVKANPNLEHGYYSLAKAYEATSKSEEALIALQHAIKADPADIECYRFRIKILGGKNLAQQLSDLNSIIGLSPNDSSSYIQRATVLIRMGNMTEAGNNLRSAARLEPKSCVIQSLLGNFYAKNGDYPRAFEQYAIALSLEPNSIEAVTYRARLYAQTGQFEKAINDYNRLGVSTDLQTVNELYAKQASKDFRALKKILLNEANSDAYRASDKVIHRAIRYMAVGQNDLAAASLEASLGEGGTLDKSTDARIPLLLCYSLEKLGLHDRALEKMKDADLEMENSCMEFELFRGRIRLGTLPNTPRTNFYSALYCIQNRKSTEVLPYLQRTMNLKQYDFDEFPLALCMWSELQKRYPSKQQ